MFKYLTILLAVLLLTASCKPVEDLVKLSEVPGFDQFKNYSAAIYSGYLKVDEHKAHHYFFAESLSNPAKDPVVLWLNGGPGCSSLLGFLYEHGPFVFPDGQAKLTYNKYNWNTKASVIYMESPACVGYSYCDDRSMPFNDNSTAQDNLDALLAFFEKFPEFVGRDFYISGESYAGIYVPYLSYWIDQHNEKIKSGSLAKTKINLKGFAVGNPVTSRQFDLYGQLPFWARHGLVSRNDRNIIDKQCSGPNRTSPACMELFGKLRASLRDLNVYDIYRYCYRNGSAAANGLLAFQKLYNEEFGDLGIPQGSDFEPFGTPPCIDDHGARRFLNNPVVRKGLHISDKVPKTWEMCSGINYKVDQRLSYWVYPHMIKKGYKIMVFAGDSDAAVTIDGTIGWTKQLQKDLKLRTLKPYTSWTLPGNVPNEPQVQGYWVKYQGFSFVTVMGIGHMVPQWNRPAAFKMWNSFLEGKDLD